MLRGGRAPGGSGGGRRLLLRAYRGSSGRRAAAPSAVRVTPAGRAEQRRQAHPVPCAYQHPYQRTRPTAALTSPGAGHSLHGLVFRLLLGLSRPTEGRLEVCGIDVAADPIGVRSRLGYMPEHDCLPLDQSAADVVSTFGELSGLPARAARQAPRARLSLICPRSFHRRARGDTSGGRDAGRRRAAVRLFQNPSRRAADRGAHASARRWRASCNTPAARWDHICDRGTSRTAS